MLLLQLLTVILATVLLIRSVNHDKRISSVEIRLKHAIKEINRSLERELMHEIHNPELYTPDIKKVPSEEIEELKDQDDGDDEGEENDFQGV